MTKSKHADKIAALQADERGEEIETKHINDNNWTSCVFPAWNFSKYEYRPKSKRKFVPWTREQVPVGSIIKPKDYPNCSYLITGINDRGEILFGESGRLSLQEVLYSYIQRSGQPCGTECEVEG